MIGRTLLAAPAIAFVMVMASAQAAPPANAPAGTTGLCKDGTYYNGPTKKGACKGHKGVKEWYAEEAPAAKGGASSAPQVKAAPNATPGATGGAASAPAVQSAAPAAGAKGGASTAPAVQTPPPAAAATQGTSSAPQVAAAPGGGAGKVWANKSTKVYHCPGDRWYGKTKEGEYMSEADAKAQGFKPDHDKACK
jgi:hypothetical protein